MYKIYISIYIIRMSIYIVKLYDGREFLSSKLSLLCEKLEDEGMEISHKNLSNLLHHRCRKHEKIYEVCKVSQYDYLCDELESIYPEYKDSDCKRKYYISKLLKLKGLK